MLLLFVYLLDFLFVYLIVVFSVCCLSIEGDIVLGQDKLFVFLLFVYLIVVFFVCCLSIEGDIVLGQDKLFDQNQVISAHLTCQGKITHFAGNFELDKKYSILQKKKKN